MNKMNDQDVNIGGFVKLMLIIIVFACMTTCTSSMVIAEDVRAIKEHIVKTGE